MVLPVHLQLAAVVAIVDCPDRAQFIDSRSLKQAALQSIWLFQESRITSDDISAKAREKIREDVGGMIGARLDFSDQDQISELEKAISNWIKKFPK